MDRFPTLHSLRNALYHSSSQRINCVNCQKFRILSSPLSQNISKARCAHPTGTSSGFDARNVPVTGCSCQKSAHIMTFTPPKTRSVCSLRCLYAPHTLTAVLTTRSNVPSNSADIMLTSSMIITRKALHFRDCLCLSPKALPSSLRAGMPLQ